jgi:hypothetical protein
MSTEARPFNLASRVCRPAHRFMSAMSVRSVVNFPRFHTRSSRNRLFRVSHQHTTSSASRSVHASIITSIVVNNGAPLTPHDSASESALSRSLAATEVPNASAAFPK